MIGPRLTTQFGLKTRLPQNLFLRSKDQIADPAALTLGTSASQPIYFSVLAQLRDVPAAQKRGKALQAWGAFPCADFVRDRRYTRPIKTNITTMIRMRPMPPPG